MIQLVIYSPILNQYYLLEVSLHHSLFESLHPLFNGLGYINFIQPTTLCYDVYSLNPVNIFLNVEELKLSTHQILMII